MEMLKITAIAAALAGMLALNVQAADAVTGATIKVNIQ